MIVVELVQALGKEWKEMKALAANRVGGFLCIAPSFLSLLPCGVKTIDEAFHTTVRRSISEEWMDYK